MFVRNLETADGINLLAYWIAQTKIIIKDAVTIHAIKALNLLNRVQRASNNARWSSSALGFISSTFILCSRLFNGK